MVLMVRASVSSINSSSLPNGSSIGITPDLPSHMADLYERNERMTRVSGDLKALEAIIRKGIK